MPKIGSTSTDRRRRGRPETGPATSITFYEAGWRFRDFLADGPYRGVSEVERTPVRCFVEQLHMPGSRLTDEENRLSITV